MIYIPGVACFIHVPRTGGNSLKSGVASHLLKLHKNCLIGNSPAPNPAVVQRHSQARYLAQWIPDWNDIRRVAVVRNPWRWVESVYRQFVRDDGLRTEFSTWVVNHFWWIEPGQYSHWCETVEQSNDNVENYMFEDPAHRSHLLTALELPTTLHIPKTNEAPLQRKLEWTEDAIKSVQRRFRGDFDRFGYPRHPELTFAT